MSKYLSYLINIPNRQRKRADLVLKNVELLIDKWYLNVNKKAGVGDIPHNR